MPVMRHRLGDVQPARGGVKARTRAPLRPAQASANPRQAALSGHRHKKIMPRDPKTAGHFFGDDWLVADVAFFILCTYQLLSLALFCPCLLIPA